MGTTLGRMVKTDFPEEVAAVRAEGRGGSVK